MSRRCAPQLNDAMIVRPSSSHTCVRCRPCRGLCTRAGATHMSSIPRRTRSSSPTAWAASPRPELARACLGRCGDHDDLRSSPLVSPADFALLQDAHIVEQSDLFRLLISV